MARNPLYVVGQSEPFKMSRAKIEEYIRCPRCFVLDVRQGIKKPSGVPFTLNVAVDNQMKKEFDHYRASAKPHPVMQAKGLDLVPFQHPDLDLWRNNFKGVQANTEDGSFLITGAVDDVWVDPDGQLYVVDYKATGRQQAVTELGVGGFYDGYRRQMEIYQWLLRKNGFKVSDTGFWVYVTATQKQDSFENTLHFEANLISYQASADWVDAKLVEIKEALDWDEVPPPGDDCDPCRFFEARYEEMKSEEDITWPKCDKCGERLSRAIYGLLPGEPPTGFASMGCIVPDVPLNWLCLNCDAEEN
jgi:hypothetical protein